MKKVLILTQSSIEGMNYKLAKECQGILEEIHSEIRNCQDFERAITLLEYSHIIMIVPEWNGSFPFMFKQVIDNSGYPSSFDGKNVLLIGSSSSSFGNIMGITHLQHILEWCGAEVFSKRICIPNIESYPFNSEEPNLRLIDGITKFLS
jgi:NAD(P)H-dependent FMN reductase